MRAGWHPAETYGSPQAIRRQEVMINRKTIAKALAQENGRFEGVTVEHGHGYWYFIDGDSHMWRQSGVYIYRMNDYTLEDWIEAAYWCKYEMTKSEVIAYDVAKKYGRAAYDHDFVSTDEMIRAEYGDKVAALVIDRLFGEG
jgi:hypothetical protein